MTEEQNINPEETPQAQPEEQASNAAAEVAEEVAEENPEKVVNPGDASEGDAEAEMLAMLEDLPEESSGADVDDIAFADGAQTQVGKAEFQHLSEPSGKGKGKNIDMLLDVNLPISIELGRTKLSIADILALGPGSVVELNKLAGEPVDLLVNQRIVAKGEVVVIDENFGVRVTQLMTPEERLKALGEDA